MVKSSQIVKSHWAWAQGSYIIDKTNGNIQYMTPGHGAPQVLALIGTVLTTVLAVARLLRARLIELKLR